MKIIPLTPETKENILENLLKRSPSQYGEYEERVNQILAKIKEEKDQALFAYTEAFDKVHVGEKITMLSSHLPSMLTDNAVVYGILSKGIHELTEEECITYFPVLKDCLYMILDQWEDMRKREEKEKEISAALSKIATNLK